MGYGRREVISRMGPEDRDLWEGLSREQGMAPTAADLRDVAENPDELRPDHAADVAEGLF